MKIIISIFFIFTLYCNVPALDFSNMFVGCDVPTGIVNIDGIVTDAVTTNPIQGANCALFRASDNYPCDAVRSDVNGHYAFMPIFTQGLFYVSVRAKTYTQQIKFTNAIGDETINFQLTQ